MDQINKVTQNSTFKGDVDKQTPKRRLNEISPVQENPDEVGKMSSIQLIKLISNVLDEKLKDMPTKSDLMIVTENVNDVKMEVSKLADENKLLQEEVQKLRQYREEDQKRMKYLEEDLGKKKIIIRGLVSQKSTYGAVKKLFNEKLNLGNRVDIEQTRKMFEKDGKMTVMVELKSVKMVSEVFKNAKNLAGSSVYIDRELSSERQQDKKIMLQMKKDILQVDKTKRIAVKNDKLVVDGQVFAWNNNKTLMCGKKPGEDLLKEWYGEKINCIALSYNEILSKISSKND